MHFDNILIETNEGVATVTINRPQALNALNTATIGELLQCFQSLESEASVRVVILTGSGSKAFVAGADIAEMLAFDPVAARGFARAGQQLFSLIESLSKPVIAAVGGFALGGGCELAMACDIRLASDNAKFGQPEINLGTIPGFAGTQRLPRLVGKGLAKELLLTGDVIGAQEACRIGLVNRVVPQDELVAASRTLAGKIAAKGALAVQWCKEAVNRGMEMEINQACAYEAELFALTFATEDRAEGMRAFVEKRKAQFKGC
ncbi:MAG: enoyl-CoA hydratase-related protein [Desulfobulbus sp.]|nr:enoyl-CoA hydratase-related protein [Desulfobulbus sp.]